MYFSRISRTIDCFIVGVLLVVGGCVSSSKPQLSVSTQAEALSHFSLGLLALSAEDRSEAFDHLQSAIRLDPYEVKLYAPTVALALDLKRNDEAIQLAKEQVKRYPDLLEPRVMLARVYALAGQPELCISVLKDIQDDFSDHPEVPLLLVRLYHALGENEEAIESLRVALENQGDSDALLLVMGALYLDSAKSLGATEEAKKSIEQGISYLQKALSKSPDNPAGWKQLGLSFLALNRVDEALNAYRVARIYAPKDFSLATQWLTLLIKTERYEEALSACAVLAKETNTDAEVWLRHIEDTIPKDDRVYLIRYLEDQVLTLSKPPAYYINQLGELYLFSEQYQKAELLLTRGMELYPDETSLNFVNGCLRMAQKRYEEAFDEFEKLRLQDTESGWCNDPYFLLNLVVSAQAIGNEDVAFDVLSNSHTNYPAVLSHYIRLTLNESDSESSKKAIQLMHRFHRSNPATTETLYFLMLLQSGVKQYPEALESAKKVESLSQTNSNSGMLNPLFYYQYASLYERTGQLEAAEELFLKVIDIGDDDPIVAAAQNYIAYMWAERGEKLDEGLILIQKALAGDPKNGAFLDTLGWIYYMQGRYEEALEPLLMAGEIEKDDPAVFEHLGSVYLKLGQRDQAFRYWKKALTLDPESKRLIELLKTNQFVD